MRLAWYEDRLFIVNRSTLPPEWYARRLAACYEQTGRPAAAAATLATYGAPADRAEAARRFIALGDLTAAGDAYLDAGMPAEALDCFRAANQIDGEIRCLLALGEVASAATRLVAAHRPAEALPHLERALADETDPVNQATLRLALARTLATLDDDTSRVHYHAALHILERLPATPESAPAWIALAEWGTASERQDRVQEGYAQALRRLEGDAERWHAMAERYRDTALAIGNRRLVAQLNAQLNTAAPAVAAPEPSADATRDLLAAGQWYAALDQLAPRAESSDDAATLLLVEIAENPAAPLAVRLRAGRTLGAVGDPRLLNRQTGDSTLGGYWRMIEPGAFWFGDERRDELRQFVLPYALRVARYPLTNAEYAPFVADGGYADPRWWSDQGWAQREQRDWEGPRFPNDDAARFGNPNQPVVGVSWHEASAFCAWLTARGHAAGWLPPNDVIRLPTALEWERVARHTDRRSYPWGDATLDADYANFDATGVGAPTPVGCFPSGAAACGALDLMGNVWEWTTAPGMGVSALITEKGVMLEDKPTQRGGAYYVEAERVYCGSWHRYDPFFGDDDWSFRLVWANARHTSTQT